MPFLRLPKFGTCGSSCTERPTPCPTRLRTTLQPAPQEGTWLLRVSDTGVGLPADFELARQSSMGLQLVTQLCQQLGGTLEVHSRPGQGAAFSVSFRVDTPAPLVMPA